MTETKKIELYGLYCPDSGELKYIGKANNAEKRLQSHIRDSRRRNTPVYIWLRSLLTEGKIPTIKILEKVKFEDWQDAEKRLILNYSKTSKLLNIACGGNEPYCSEEVRAGNARRMTIKRLELKKINPKKARFIYLKQQLNILLSQGFVSDLTKLKMRECAIKRPDLFPAKWATL